MTAEQLGRVRRVKVACQGEARRRVDSANLRTSLRTQGLGAYTPGEVDMAA
jgi:hypothetical protein